MSINRRSFLKGSLAAGAALSLPGLVIGDPLDRPTTHPSTRPALVPKADAMVLIYLPGGIAQHDMWDCKQHTPFRAGMKGSELLGTCPIIDTSADTIKLGAGLENLAQVMHHATVLRTLSSDTKFGAIHLKAQYYLMTGYLFPAGFKAPSIGAVVSRTLGRRDPNVPPYIYIGRDIDTSDNERLFISEYLGPGFYGVNHQPFMIPNAAEGLATLHAQAGMETSRLDRRQRLLARVAAMQDPSLKDSPKAAEYLRTMNDARVMMDSPVKKAFDFAKEESRETIEAYQPQITARELRDGSYYYGDRFGSGLLLARRLLESGARFIQVDCNTARSRGGTSTSTAHPAWSR
jgi:hypothetical protein